MYIYCVYLFSADVFSHVWNEVDKIGNDTEAAQVRHMVVAAKAPATVSQYHRLFLRWRAFAIHKGIPDIPATKAGLALFINTIRLTHNSRSLIDSSRSAIAWAHHMLGFSNPFDDPWLKNILEGAKRLIVQGAPCTKKPVDLDLIKSVISNTDFNNLKSLRATTMIVLLFCGFLRISEVLNIKCSDLSFSPTHLIVKICSSKTDQLRRGNDVTISASSLPTCPVNIVSKYLTLAKLNLSSHEYLFRALSFKKSGCYVLTTKNKPICYSTAREVILSCIKPFTSDISEYGTHSFRRGGATLASDQGVDHRLLMGHGRWQSTKAKDMYVVDSVEKKCSVSFSLGL